MKKAPDYLQGKTILLMCISISDFCSKTNLHDTKIALRHKISEQIHFHIILIFFHPDYTVGFGITPNHALRLVGYTTGRESHPALKMLFNCVNNIPR